ncbi:hypothetical protein OH805_11625 [Streptomyces sp. NBC_00879]|uniref:hypothetical protein n=1 Tax=Streptomyces sp. NBC_00879 TaxID=2975855 RepID=UPI0038694823|nr:hypothetical protein OH805_11625 [Streptomyces sp. NBC_00879]
MRVKKIAPAVIAATAALAGVLVSGTPAQAATVTKFCSMPFERAGVGCFYSTGDTITVQDMWADGLRSVVVWGSSDGKSGECHDANGANNPPTTCKYDVAENGILVFHVESRSGAKGKASNATAPITAWTSGR